MKDNYIFINGSRIKDLTGSIFNNLEVISFSEIKNRYAYWNCKCICGNEIIVSSKDLIGNRKKSCGCIAYIKEKRINADNNIKETTNKLIGKKFGKLTVKEFTKLINSMRYYLCLCDCGNYKEVSENNLINGFVKSCGCIGGGKNTDLTGKIFGELKVLEFYKIENGKKIWKCQCECGNLCYYSTSDLNDGQFKSCGHYKDIEKIMHTKIGIVINPQLNKNNTSGVKGVYPHKNSGKWIASIQFQKKNYYLGIYNKLEDASKIRKIAEEKLHGEFLEWYKNEYMKGENNESEKNND